MRSAIALMLCVAFLAITAGCSDDDCTSCPDPTCPEQALAEVFYDYELTLPGTFSSMYIDFKYRDTPAVLVYQIFDNDDDNVTFEFDSGNSPDFDTVVGLLTNGVDDRMMLSVQFYPTGGGSGSMMDESSYFKGGPTGTMLPDLAGAEITRFLLHMGNVYINASGGNTTYMVDFRIVIMGRI